MQNEEMKGQHLDEDMKDEDTDEDMKDEETKEETIGERTRKRNQAQMLFKQCFRQSKQESEDAQNILWFLSESIRAGKFIQNADWLMSTLMFIVRTPGPVLRKHTKQNINYVDEAIKTQQSANRQYYEIHKRKYKKHEVPPVDGPGGFGTKIKSYTVQDIHKELVVTLMTDIILFNNGGKIPGKISKRNERIDLIRNIEKLCGLKEENPEVERCLQIAQDISQQLQHFQKICAQYQPNTIREWLKLRRLFPLKSSYDMSTQKPEGFDDMFWNVIINISSNIKTFQKQLPGMIQNSFQTYQQKVYYLQNQILLSKIHKIMNDYCKEMQLQSILVFGGGTGFYNSLQRIVLKYNDPLGLKFQIQKKFAPGDIDCKFKLVGCDDVTMTKNAIKYFVEQIYKMLQEEDDFQEAGWTTHGTQVVETDGYCIVNFDDVGEYARGNINTSTRKNQQTYGRSWCDGFSKQTLKKYTLKVFDLFFDGTHTGTLVRILKPVTLTCDDEQIDTYVEMIDIMFPIVDKQFDNHKLLEMFEHEQYAYGTETRNMKQEKKDAIDNICTILNLKNVKNDIRHFVKCINGFLKCSYDDTTIEKEFKSIQKYYNNKSS